MKVREALLMVIVVGAIGTYVFIWPRLGNAVEPSTASSSPVSVNTGTNVPPNAVNSATDDSEGFWSKIKSKAMVIAEATNSKINGFVDARDEIDKLKSQNAQLEHRIIQIQSDYNMASKSAANASLALGELCSAYYSGGLKTLLEGGNLDVSGRVE